MTGRPQSTSAGPDLSGLDAITEAIGSGAGLPEVVRAASRVLDASIVLLDRAESVLAVAALSPADEQSLVPEKAGVESLELRVADEPVGTLRLRARSAELDPSLVRIVSTLVASEVERVRAPARASQQATGAFLRGVLGRELAAPEDILQAAEQLNLDLTAGATVIVARAHPHAPSEDGWRLRVLAAGERGARAAVPGSIASLSEKSDLAGAQITLLVPGDDEALARRAAEQVLSELQAAMGGHSFAVGRSRVAAEPSDLARAGNEALLAANVAEGDPDRPLLAFDDTGAYRLLLPAMSEDPDELQRFYAETVEPLVAYDEQYATDLVQTVEAFLEADGNVAGTAQRLFTHRHTIRYRLERVRELSGLDVGSTDGREKLSLGLKAMRVLGIAKRSAPASEDGAEGGRVPRR